MGSYTNNVLFVPLQLSQPVMLDCTQVRMLLGQLHGLRAEVGDQ